jgi:hypothetical protein
VYRLTLSPWCSLNDEEREQALFHARQLGQIASLADGKRAAVEYKRSGGGGDPWRFPMAGDYVTAVCRDAPARWRALWHSRTLPELAQDPRVCVFVLAWEDTRRGACRVWPVPTDAPTLIRILTGARTGWRKAREGYLEASRVVAEAGPLPVGDDRRIALGLANVRVWHARDEYWLWLMLTRARGVHACAGLGLTDGEEETWETEILAPPI